jgi:hypothetical protein
MAQSLLAAGAGGWYPVPGEAVTVDELEDLLHRVSAASTEEMRRMAVEKLQGWGQWAALEPLSPEVRARRVLDDPGMHTWGLHQRLIEASRWYNRLDPQEAVDIVQLAIMVADHISPARLGSEEARHDLIAESYALLGDSQRLASDFEASRLSYSEAWQREEMGTANPYTKAYITRLEAHWMIDMGEFEVAEARGVGPFGLRRRQSQSSPLNSGSLQDLFRPPAPRSALSGAR